MAYVFRSDTVNSIVLAADATAGDTVIELDNVTGVLAGDIVHLRSNKVRQNADGLISVPVDVNKIIAVNAMTNEITLEWPIFLDFEVSDSARAEIITPQRNNAVLGAGKFVGGGVTENLGNGLGRMAIAAVGVENFTVEGDHTFEGFQGVAVWPEYCLNVKVLGGFFDGVPAGTVIVEGQNSGFYGVYAVRCRNVLTGGGIGVRVRHLYDALDSINVKQYDAIAELTHRAAFGSHESVWALSLENLTSYRCYGGYVARAEEIEVSDCEWNDCTQNIFATYTGETTDIPTKLVDRNNSGNLLDIAGASANAISIAGAYNQLEMVGSDYSAPQNVVRLNPRHLENFDISRNRLTQTTATANRYCIDATANAAATFRNGRIEDNDLHGFTLNGVRLNGAGTRDTPLESVSVSDNRGFGAAGSGAVVLLGTDGWYGDNVQVSGNKSDGPGATTFIATSPVGRFRSAPLTAGNIEPMNAAGTSTARPEYIVGSGTGASPSLTGHATILQGAVFLRRNPVVGGPSRWHCTQSGTEGSFSGVTGDITSGSPTLTLTGNDATKAYPGSFISVAGAGAAGGALVARVVSLSSDNATATLSVNASTTVTGEAVTRRNPVWSEAGHVGNTYPASDFFAAAAGQIVRFGATLPDRSAVISNYTVAGTGQVGYRLNSPGTGGTAEVTLAALNLDGLRVRSLSGRATVVIGPDESTSGSIATNANSGFLYIPTCAGTPTGTPFEFLDRSPLVIDRTNNKLYFYSGGAWRDAGP
jgi:hypothetical protein